MIRIKKCLIILTIILLVNPISFAQIILAEGTLVDESFIEIENSDELAAIKDNLTENYILTNDIDLKDTEWEPIDSGEFTGTLTSNEFKIKSMPAKYSEDENFGLFTEVADSENVDVEIEFITEEPKVKEELEEPQTEEEIIEEVEDEVVEERLEELQDEKELKAKVEKKEQMQTTQAIGEARDVANYTQFKAALENRNVTEINLKGNVEARSGILYRIVIEPRDLVIKGNGYEIKQNKDGPAGIATSYSMMRFNNTQNKTITFKNVKLISENGNSLLTEAGSNSEWKVIFEDVNKEMNVEKETKSYDGRLVNAEHAHVEFKETVNFITETESIITDAKSVTVNSQARVSLKTKGKVYEASKDIDGAKLHVMSSGGLFLYGSGETNISAVELEGANSEILIEGRFMIGSDRKVIGKNTGLISLLGANAKFNVIGGATAGFSNNQGSILHMKSRNGEVNVSGKGTKVQFSIEEGNGDFDAPIHFDNANNYKLNVSDGARFEVEKKAGKAAGMIFGTGSGHKLTVSNGGKFFVYNKGDGVATDPAGYRATNQALHFNGTVPEFNLTGKGSEVSLVADSGVAMHMTAGGIIRANDGTIFVARGKTKRDDRGIIDTGGVDDVAQTQILLTNPAYYDFRNENTEGIVFHVGINAEIIGDRIDLAVWERGENIDLEGPPAFRYSNIVRYKYIQADFTSFLAIGSAGSTTPELAALHSKGGSGNPPRGPYPNGLREFARVSGNTAEAVVDEVYQPTNADKKIYAHVSVDEGIFGKRNVGTDEAEVDIKHTKISDGSTHIYKGKTIGQDQYPEQDVYEIYGKPVDPKIGAFGWVEIETEGYLETGDTLEVVGARIKAANHTTTESDPEYLFNEKRIVVDVTPPDPTEIVNTELTEYSESLEGILTEENAVVSVEVNGEDPNGEVTYNRANGTFTYRFTNRLNVGDEVQVFLSDNTSPSEGLGEQANRPDRPITHADNGNINPRETLTYHDKEFVQAPMTIVGKHPGVLKFMSVPDNLNFNVKVKPYKDEYLVNLHELGKPLKISDSRMDKKKWELHAKVAQQLTNNENELTNALIYRGEDVDVRLNHEASIVKTQIYTKPSIEKEVFDLSADWGDNGNGLFVEIDVAAQKAEYIGKVEWTLSNTP